jgi:hypothetical protein
VAAPPVNLYVRVTGGYYPGSESSSGVPVIAASGVRPPAFAGQAYMVYPAGQGDLIWQGGVFGLSAPTSGGLIANVWQVMVTVSHHCSSPAAFSSVTAQIYDTSTSTVIGSKAFTLSSTQVTETITLTTGFTAADVPDLAVRMVWHQTAPGYATVQHSYAEISYSYSDSIGSVEIDPVAQFGTTAINVTPPPVALVSQGSAAFSFTPSFGKATAAGDLLLAWVYSNSSNASFGTSCADPSWTLAGHAGGMFGWRSLWYKPHCKAAETAPVFSDTAASEPLSQLLEFSGAAALDQVTGATGTPDVTYTAPGPDTASGDLVFGFATWNGSNAGPTTITLSGTDSHGTALALTQADNHTSTGVQFWATGWAQASAPAGPGTDTMTADLGFFAGGGGMMASFKAIPAVAVTAYPVITRMPARRAVVIPVRAG